MLHVQSNPTQLAISGFEESCVSVNSVEMSNPTCNYTSGDSFVSRCVMSLRKKNMILFVTTQL